MKSNRISSQNAWRMIEEINRLHWMLTHEELAEICREEWQADIEKWKTILEEESYQAFWIEQRGCYALSSKPVEMNLSHLLSSLQVSDQETEPELVAVEQKDQIWQPLPAVIGSTIRFQQTYVETCISYARTDGKQVDLTLVHETDTFCIGIMRTKHNPGLHFAHYLEFSLEEVRLLHDLLSHPEVKKKLRREEW